MCIRVIAQTPSDFARHPDRVSDLVAYLKTRKTQPGPDITQAR